MLKSAPKWLKLMPEILKMPIFVTQFNFKVSKCAQIKLKSKKHVPKIGIKIQGVKVSVQWRGLGVLHVVVKTLDEYTPH
jgi:hypothetical protein